MYDAAVQPFTVGNNALTVQPNFLPVVFRKAIDANQLLKNYNPGIPFSVYDISILGKAMGIDFLGATRSIDANSGDDALAHAHGDAVDISLLPYYIKTGIVMNNPDGLVLGTTVNKPVSPFPYDVDPEVTYLTTSEQPYTIPRTTEAPTNVPAASPVLTHAVTPITAMPPLKTKLKHSTSIEGQLQQVANQQTGGALNVSTPSDLSELVDKGMTHLDAQPLSGIIIS
jgi:hypothetical protein